MKLVEKIAAIFAAMVLTTTVASAQEVKHVAANGLSFAYVEAGSGPPLVLIHGSVSDYREWSKQFKPLASHYRIIAYSRRYHWPNAVPTANADASLEVQVEDLAAIIKTLKIGPAHIVGHSYGGAVALQLALRHPELVRTLVLAEPGVASVLTEAPEDQAARSREGQANRIAMKEAFASGDAERIVRTIAADVAPGVYEKAGRDVRQMLLDNVPAFQLDYNSRRLPFTCDVAKKITAPALILAGERSPQGLQHIAEKTAGCLMSAKFVRIPQATHWIPHDQPQKFTEALLDFLANYKQPDELVQRVDHLVYATPDLDRGIAEIESSWVFAQRSEENIPGEGLRTLSLLSAQTLSWRSLHPIRINRHPKTRVLFSRALRNHNLSDGSLAAVTSRAFGKRPSARACLTVN